MLSKEIGKSLVKLVGEDYESLEEKVVDCIKNGAIDIPFTAFYNGKLNARNQSGMEAYGWPSAVQFH